jgi:hypothetical protein
MVAFSTVLAAIERALEFSKVFVEVANNRKFEIMNKVRTIADRNKIGSIKSMITIDKSNIP